MASTYLIQIDTDIYFALIILLLLKIIIILFYKILESKNSNIFK